MRILLALISTLLLGACAVAPVSPKPQPRTIPDRTEVAARTLDATVLITTQFGHGSGYFIAPNVVATAKHVVDDVPVIAPVVTTRWGSECAVHKLAVVDNDDVALLEVTNCGQDRSIDCLALPTIGRWVLAAGNPLDSRFSVVDGILSATDVDAGGYWPQPLLQFSAPTAPGSSGGPIAANDGCLVGMTVAGSTHPRGGGIHYAVPASRVFQALRLWKSHANNATGTQSTPSSGAPIASP